MAVSSPTAPPGLAVCAVGDIHGCLSHLDALLERIDATAGETDLQFVFLGDYIDRGPDSAGVIERLIGVRDARPDTVFLRGNHEAMFLDFLDDPPSIAAVFLTNGGEETLRSYGCVVGRARSSKALAQDALERMPEAHLNFLHATTFSARFGDYFFCHAGVRPDVPLSRQSPDHLMWIRNRFLDSDADFGAVVVHGHTPSTEPVTRPNRIGIDTGAVFGGPLTAVILEGGKRRFVQAT